MNRGYFEQNLKFLKATDEIKFVITSQADYEWAKNQVLQSTFPTREILFSPAQPLENSPGKIEGIEPRFLAESILRDRLPVRFQLQLHKILWGNIPGV